jgi:acetyltransferase
MDLEPSKKKVAALTAPRNIVLVGASDRPGSWATRVWRSLNRNAFPGPMFPINPGRSEIWDTRCYADFSSLPEPPDHLVMLVPAANVPEMLQAGAQAGARSATIFSAGFGEGGDAEGSGHRRRLAAVIDQTGLGVSGPNCMGNICAKSRLVTLVEDRLQPMKRGPVALVGQSGGVMIFLNHSLEERGLSAEYLITSGNEIGLSLGDYIAFFAGEPQLKVIIVYLERVSDLPKLQAACRLARDAGKAVIAVKLGQSEAGRQAALAHTGALAGSVEAFDAVMAECGVLRADTLDDAVEITELLSHTGAPAGRRLGAITLSGAFRGILLDAAERNGLLFPALAAETEDKLKSVLSVGSHVGNPVDGGFGIVSSADKFMACVDALNADPNIDAILLQEALPREQAGSARAEKYIRLINEYATSCASKPISFVTLVSHGQSEHSRALRSETPHVSFLQEANKALRAIESVVRRAEIVRFAAAESAAPDISPQSGAIIERVRERAASAAGQIALNEVDSKELLRSYGIASPAERLVQSAAEAAAAADALGYPVVLKAISAELLHKSDAGAVMLNLSSPDQVAAAHERIVANVEQHGCTGRLDGILVCRQVMGGVELALGLHRDTEMGLVVMAGSGGILLELVKDVAFLAPPISREKAIDMLARTRAAKLLNGYRGAPKLDTGAVIDALVNLGRLATDLEDVIDGVDINPFVVLPQGGVALDGLVLLRCRSGDRI